jgi:hypothetical protein
LVLFWWTTYILLDLHFFSGAEHCVQKHISGFSVDYVGNLYFSRIIPVRCFESIAIDEYLVNHII